MFTAPQARAGVPSGRQSVLPTVRGVPWWGAVLVALVPTAVGALIDGAVSDELSIWFRVLYVIGCVAAVLSVRRKALFTAITQPPLVAFGIALLALYSLESGSASGVRGLVINVMLPVAKTFPLMAWTFVVVGALGGARWYLTRESGDGAAQPHRRRATSARRADGARRAGATTDGAARSRRRSAGSRGDDARLRDGGDRPTRHPDDRAARRTRSDGTAPRGERRDDGPRRGSPPRRAGDPRRDEWGRGDDRRRADDRRRDDVRRDDRGRANDVRDDRWRGDGRRAAEPGVVAREAYGAREPYRPMRPPVRRPVAGEAPTEQPSTPRARYRDV